MDAGKTFVGRKAELEQFEKVLEDPKGQAILVVGQAGMGKTWLVNKMAEIAENHPKLKCGWVRYEVTPTDSVDSTMALMMDNAFEAAQVEEGSFNGTTRRLEQWKNLLNVINIGDLVMSLRRDKQRNTREQFLERLNLISKKMPKDGRTIFVIDPEKYLQDKSDYSWGIVVRSLPEKIKFIFAQRTDDVLVKGEVFKELKNVVRIPEGELEKFDKETIKKLADVKRDEVPKKSKELQDVALRTDGSPYSVTGTLELIAGADMKAEELAQYLSQEEVARAQWRGICDKGDEAKQLFEAYAVLEVGVPDDVVQKVSRLSDTTRKRLQKDSYLRGLLREEGEGKRIYHAILADYILDQIGKAESKKYHGRAVSVYRGKLERAEKEKTKPDALAATRFAEHILAADGEEAFVYACAYKIYIPLNTLGLLDVALGLSRRTLDVVKKDSKEESAVLCILGLIYQTKGDLDEAEKMHLKAFEIERDSQREEGMAREYGNLGLVYYRRGDLDKAEEMHLKALEINEKLGRLEGMANGYAAIGLVYDARGKLDKAETMHIKGLEIEKDIGRIEGIGRQCGNLGNVYYAQGELDKAEEMHKKSLENAEKRGALEGMAREYDNLGLVYEKRGNFSKAKDCWEKALELFMRVGIPHKVEKVEGFLERLVINDD